MTIRAGAGGSVFALSFHAAYACRDRGACCTAGWPIPIEARELTRVEHAIADGRLPLPPGTVTFVRPRDAPADTPALVATTGGACVFYRHSRARHCDIHHALGHGALPLACRQFPRVSVVDPRGVSVTLSHYCPTAADLLEGGADASIVETPVACPPGAEYVGLDMREALPPALRPGMLMDWEAWWRWEARAVSTIARAADPETALAQLSAAVEHARGWHPGQGALIDRVDAAFDAAGRDAAARRIDPPVDDIVAAVPEDLRPGAFDALGRRSTPMTRHAHQRFLMAHAFANWTAHLGEGLRSWLRSIEAAHGLAASGLAAGDADLLLRHLADPAALAAGWSRTEGM